MTKAKNKKRGEYEEPLKVKGSFLDIIKASVTDAENEGPKKRSSKKQKSK